MATVFTGSNVKVGPGTLYCAPLGTTEPVSVSGVWPTGWNALGYTTAGSTFDITPTLVDVTVEEEYWPVAEAITKYDGTLAFALSEPTAANLALALNLGTTPAAASQATYTDGTVWTDPPQPGLEVDIMLGWDALPKGGTAGDPFMRTIFRQCIQSGAMKMDHKKGNAPLTFSVSFKLIKPPTAQAVRFLQPNYFGPAGV